MTDPTATTIVKDPTPAESELASSRFWTLLGLCRVSNLPTVWMNVLTAAVLASGSLNIAASLLLMVSLSAFYCAGMALNDVFDREHDALEQPFRPIPAGRIGLGEACAVAVALFAVALGLLVVAPYPSALLPGCVLVVLIFAYDRFHKEMPASVVVMASTRFMVFVVTGWAIVGAPEGPVLAAGLLQFAYTMSVTAVARFESTRGEPFAGPVIPRMIAGMSVLDGAVLAIWVHPAWLAAGLAAAVLSRFGQRYVRGD